MLLSEAILLGSTMVKPRRGFILSQLTGDITGCALGMAYKALGFAENGYFYVPASSPIHATLQTLVVVPCACFGPPGYQTTIQDAIAHIFDGHVVLDGDGYRPFQDPWTLEQLVDWVRSQESQPQVESIVNEEAKETVCSV